MANEEEISNQLQLLALHRQTLQHYLQQEALLGQAFAPPVVNAGIKEARAQIRRVKEVLSTWGITVDDLPNDTDVSTAQSTTSTASTTASEVSELKLHRALVDAFSKSELKDLCFELNIQYEDLEGDTLSGKARELIGYMRRRRRLNELAEAIARLRPGMP